MTSEVTNETKSGSKMSINSFFEEITAITVDLDVVSDALKNDPSLLTTTNHNGLFAIQVAAHRGLKPLIQMLIDLGADIEVTTNDGRTPVAIACQGGSLYAVNTFCDNGANMETKDSYGRTLMHHAATVGAVHIMHYLHVRCGLRYDVTDDEGYTSLHLSVWNDHTEAVKYLLKNKRCGDINAASRYGSTALTISAKNGNYTISRLIIRSTNQNLLHKKDGNNLSPIDHARLGKSERHKMLASKLLEWTSLQIHKSYMPSYDTLVWYFILVLPGSSLTLACFTFVTIPYMLISIPLCLLLVAFGFFSPLVQHRLPGDEGYQNPSPMGAFITGLTLTLVCYFVEVFPRLWPSNLFWFILVGVDYLLILYMFWKLEHTDPGFDSIGKTTSDGTPLTIVDVAKQDPYQSTHQYSFCINCEIVLPEVSKHCKLCGRCCNGFDHHCLWLQTCVGYKNHRMFIIFLFLLLMDNFLFVRGGIAVFVMLSDTYDPGIFLKHAIVNEKFLIFLVLCNFLTGIFALLNFLYQLSIVSMRETTYFDAKGKAAFRRRRDRNVSWITRLTNLKIFFTSSSHWYDSKIRPKSYPV